MNAKQRRKERHTREREHNAGIETLPVWMQDRWRNPPKASTAELLETIQRYGKEMKEKEAKKKAEERENKIWLGIVAGIMAINIAAGLLIIINILSS